MKLLSIENASQGVQNKILRSFANSALMRGLGAAKIAIDQKRRNHDDVSADALAIDTFNDERAADTEAEFELAGVAPKEKIDWAVVADCWFSIHRYLVTELKTHGIDKYDEPMTAADAWEFMISSDRQPDPRGEAIRSMIAERRGVTVEQLKVLTARSVTAERKQMRTMTDDVLDMFECSVESKDLDSTWDRIPAKARLGFYTSLPKKILQQAEKLEISALNLADKGMVDVAMTLLSESNEMLGLIPAIKVEAESEAAILEKELEAA